MDFNKIKYSIFTKPWKNESVDELGQVISKMGFNAIEFALRDGYQVTPENAVKELKNFANKMAEYDIKISSVASDTTENIFAACQDAGVPLIRIMCKADLKLGYMKSEANMKKQIESFLPLCEKYGVKVGIQHHFGPGVSNSMELRHLLEGYDPKYVGAIWDAAHSGLAGEEPEQGLDIVWDYLALVNLKNAVYAPKVSGHGTEETKYRPYFTTGKHGNCDWDRVIKFLCNKDYKGDICMPAEYTDESNVEIYTQRDLKYIKETFKKYCDK
ncbi:MAG: sugar phosphate isomerase/epimerase [Clostridia bacterium]